MEQTVLTQKKEIINLLLKQNIIVNTEILEKISKQETLNSWLTALKQGKKFEDLIKEKNKIEQKIITPKSGEIKIVFDYDKPIEKKSIQDFIAYFNNRYKQLNTILQTRGGLQNLTSIARIQGKQDREAISVIAYVVEKGTTKNENIMLTLEDDTGIIKAIVTKDKEEIYKQAKDLVVDEVIGVNGTTGTNIIFINSLMNPDIPVQAELKKADAEVNVAILSDIHLGSDLFLEKEFQTFINWCKGEYGTQEQKEIAQKTKYIIIAGDLIDGVGIYPNQNEELVITDVSKQYEKLSEYLLQIPKDKQIIIIPGNHDTSRLSEPQLKINKQYAKSIYEMPNTISISSPGRILIKPTAKSPEFDFLIYHGYSFVYYGDKVDSIRNSGKNTSDRADQIMKFLLQRRHLAPSHTSNLYVPDKEKDEMIIEKIPDFFIAGHVHKSVISTYRGVSLVTGSCWQSKTNYQEKMGNEPDPCKVPIINLQTREIKIIDFSQND